MRALMKLNTATGGTVEPFRIGTEIELVTRNAAGHTISSFSLPEDDAWTLLDSLREELDA